MRTLLAFAGFGLLAGRAAAQHALYVQNDDNHFVLVQDAYDSRPMIVKDGKYAEIHSSKFALQGVEEYLPAYVSVNDVRVNDEALISGTHRMNETFSLFAHLESDYALDHVFIVLELNTDDLGNVVFIRKVSDLRPKKPVTLSLAVPIAHELGEGHYTIHIFSDGMEVLNSKMPFMAAEHALDKMVRKRIQGVRNGPPRPFVGPSPEYPASLSKSKVKGTAVVKMTIRQNGDVLNPVVKSASDPAFGDSAVRALRSWKFIPAVKDGYPVEMSVEMPINFVYTGG